MATNGFFGSKASLLLLVGLLVVGLEVLGSVVYYSFDRGLGLVIIFCGIIVVCMSVFVGFLMLVTKIFKGNSNQGAK